LRNTRLRHQLQLREHFEVHTPARALVGEGGIGEAVAQHHGVARERGAYDLHEVVAARGKGQQRLGQRVHGLGEQQGAQLFRKRRAAGLARAHHLAPLRAKRLRERLEV
jgi:hypothetical protein